MDDELPFEAEQVDEFAIGDNEPLPLPFARISRLCFPIGPLKPSWLHDQISARKIRSAMLVPRDKLKGIRLVDLRSLISHIESLSE